MPAKKGDRVLCMKNNDNEYKADIKRHLDMLWTIHSQHGSYCDKCEKRPDQCGNCVLRHPTADTIYSNPIYKAAEDLGDELLMHQIKLYYRIASREECEWLSDRLGARILPSLPESFDKDYIVEIDDQYIRLLKQSGYSVMHTPYFSMRGKTHSKWSLNPHKKNGIDAARVDSDAISFAAFLDMFRIDIPRRHIIPEEDDFSPVEDETEV